jgi:uncharacterized protein (TIGR04255 family)
MSPKFNFPPDIKLKNNPLIEAWLEIRWQLVPGDVANFMRDPGFPFALGAFYKNIKNEFGYREDLEASHAPDEMLPYVVRHRFRPDKDKWPVLQLGPGVASVNFVDSYSWNAFSDLALYLREKLLDAYGETELKTQAVTLRYRNGEPFEYSSNNLLDFLRQNLNTSIALPVRIPGSVSSLPWPTSINVNSTFELIEPKGTGAVRFGTGKRGIVSESKKDELLIWELEVSSRNPDAPNLNEKTEFVNWLTLAHSVIHEWFFSMVEGPLFRKYKDEEG